MSAAQVAIVENKRGGLTSNDGRFLIRTTPGTYTVRVTAPGFASVTRQVSVAEGATRMDLQLSK